MPNCFYCVVIKPIFHQKLGSHWVPYVNEIDTNNMKCIWPTQAPMPGDPTPPILHLLALGQHWVRWDKRWVCEAFQMPIYWYRQRKKSMSGGLHNTRALRWNIGFSVQILCAPRAHRTSNCTKIVIRASNCAPVSFLMHSSGTQCWKSGAYLVPSPQAISNTVFLSNYFVSALKTQRFFTTSMTDSVYCPPLLLLKVQ